MRQKDTSLNLNIIELLHDIIYALPYNEDVCDSLYLKFTNNDCYNDLINAIKEFCYNAPSFYSNISIDNCVEAVLVFLSFYLYKDLNTPAEGYSFLESAHTIIKKDYSCNYKKMYNVLNSMIMIDALEECNESKQKDKSIKSIFKSLCKSEIILLSLTDVIRIVYNSEINKLPSNLLIFAIDYSGIKNIKINDYNDKQLIIINLDNHNDLPGLAMFIKGIINDDNQEYILLLFFKDREKLLKFNNIFNMSRPVNVHIKLTTTVGRIFNNIKTLFNKSFKAPAELFHNHKSFLAFIYYNVSIEQSSIKIINKDTFKFGIRILNDYFRISDN